MYLYIEQYFVCPSCLMDMGVAYIIWDIFPSQTLLRPSGQTFIGSYLEPYSLLSRFVSGEILSTPSRFVRQCKISIQNCHSCKRCYFWCHINWVQGFHLKLDLNLYLLFANY